MSSLKSVFAPHLGHNVKFGRNEPTTRKLHRKFGAYKLPSLPTPPPSTNYREKADSVLRDIYGNDQVGDCVIAAGYHVEGVATGNAGDLFHATLDQIIKDYGKIGHYVVGDESTDNGCDEDTALTYWCQYGFASGVKLLGYLAIDPTNWLEIQQAIWLFENVFYGVGLPDQWISPFPSGDGFTWDLAGAANPRNGHAFVGVDYNPHGVIIDTWALEGTVTPIATATYAAESAGGQLFVLLTPSLIAKGQAKAPNGFDWSALITDFNAMGGAVPTPSPAPTPAPSSGVTLAQAQEWAVAGLRSSNTTWRYQAEKLVKKGLAAKWPIS